MSKFYENLELSWFPGISAQLKLSIAFHDLDLWTLTDVDVIHPQRNDIRFCIIHELYTEEK